MSCKNIKVTLITCDDCKKVFAISNKKIKTEKICNDIERTYFTCSKCKKKYVISYFDKEIKENIKKLKCLRGEYLRKEITLKNYEKKCKNLIERNKSLNARYKALYGR